MNEFLILFTAVASLVTLSLVWYTFLVTRSREKREFKKDPRAEINGRREQLELDLFSINERIANSPYGYSINKNIYNEDLSDVSLCWNVKDDSFFESQGFDVDLMTIEPDAVTCLMPFHKEFDRIYNRIIHAAKESQFTCKRSDGVYKEGNIMKYTIELILKAQIVVAVLDGRNPNVYYEVGIAHSVGKPVILIAAENRKEEIPFDLKQHRFIFYNSMNDLQEKLTDALNYIRANG